MSNQGLYYKNSLVKDDASEGWVEKKPSNVAFLFTRSGENKEKLVVYRPCVPSDAIDAKKLEAEIDNASFGFKAFCDERCAIEEPNKADEEAKLVTADPKKFVIRTPSKCQMTSESREKAIIAFSKWVAAAGEALLPSKKDEKNKGADKPKPSESKDPTKKGGEKKDEKKDEKNKPAKVHPIDKDPGNWSNENGDFEAWFEGTAVFPEEDNKAENA